MGIEVENGDNLVTVGILPKKRGQRHCANPFFLLGLLVPRDRIELPTRGFSVPCPWRLTSHTLYLNPDLLYALLSALCLAGWQAIKLESKEADKLASS